MTRKCILENLFAFSDNYRWGQRIGRYETASKMRSFAFHPEQSPHAVRWETR